MKTDAKRVNDFLVRVPVSRDSAEAQPQRCRWHCFAGLLLEVLGVSQVGNDVHSSLAVHCSEKHLSFVPKNLSDSMTPLK